MPTYVASSNFAIINGNFKFVGIIFTQNLLDMSEVNFEAKAIDVRNLQGLF